MRALRVVGFDGVGDSGVVILEDLDRHERFTVPADERLRAAARGDILRLGQMSTDMESQLRPREIQTRIRAGASVEQVAQAAGVPTERIERFAYPVLLERSRYAELAQQAHPVREDGPDVRTLAETVTHTFGLRGQEYDQAEWDSWRGEDNKWVVTLSWSVGHSDITARWTYHPGAHGGTVTALDEHATDLVDGQLARPPRRLGPVVDFSKPDELPFEPGARDGAPRETPRETSSRTATDDLPTPAAPEPGRSASGQSGSARGGQPSARTAPAKARTEPPAEPPAAAGHKTAGHKAAASHEAEPEPANPAEDAQPAAGARSSKRPRKGKPVMPSWEDVLLGVKTQR
jgi:hypothetical protein